MRTTQDSLELPVFLVSSNYLVITAIKEAYYATPLTLSTLCRVLKSRIVILVVRSVDVCRVASCPPKELVNSALARTVWLCICEGRGSLGREERGEWMREGRGEEREE